MKTASASESTRPDSITGDRIVDELARAVLSGDTVSAHRILVGAIDGRGVAGAWSDVVSPLLADLGIGVESADVAASFSCCVSSVMATVTVDSPAPFGSPRVLLATLPGEPVDLEMRTVAAALARGGVDARMLASSMTTGALVSAVSAARPDVLVFWLSSREMSVLPLVRALRRRCRGLRILLAGGGSASEHLPRSIACIGGVRTAPDAVFDAVG